MIELKFTVPLPPISKKNSQQILTNRATGRPFISPSKQYKQYERDAKHFIPRLKEPISEEVNVQCLYYMPTKRRVDLVNLLEATCDLLVKFGVLEDDNADIVASHDGSRVIKGAEFPRTEIYITKK